MVIAITSPTAGAFLGQGVELNGTISGPTLLDDECLVSISTNLGGGHFVQPAFGSSLLGGLNFWRVVLGWDAIQGLFVGSDLSGGAPPGSALFVAVIAKHHAGAVFDNLSVAGYFLDGVSGIANLLQKILIATSAPPVLDRTFPPP